PFPIAYHDQKPYAEDSRRGKSCPQKSRIQKKIQHPGNHCRRAADEGKNLHSKPAAHSRLFLIAWKFIVHLLNLNPLLAKNPGKVTLDIFSQKLGGKSQRHGISVGAGTKLQLIRAGKEPEP